MHSGSGLDETDGSETSLPTFNILGFTDGKAKRGPAW